MILGAFADLAALLIAGSLLLTAYLVHTFWEVGDPQMRRMDQIQFSTDIALEGAALVMFYAWNQLEATPGYRSPTHCGRDRQRCDTARACSC